MPKVNKSTKIESLEQYKHFFINTHDLTCIANTDGYFEIINPNWKKVLVYSEKELLENPFYLFHSFIHSSR